MKKSRKPIEEQLAEIETRLSNAEEYVAKNVNVEGKSFLHFDDWKGKSGHPLWMKNHAIPTLKKAPSRREKVLRIIENKTKEKELTKLKRLSSSNSEQ